MNLNQRGTFPNFAGVALADILANSVAIVILMIVVTVFIKHEEDQKKLEQVEDVSVLLSREIATSVVMNALPTSPPAVLHDYVSSSFDINPQPTVMPIIELHDDHVRNHYTGKRIGREELLLQDNSLDKFFREMTPDQLARVRVDIYSINTYYIVMSIFKTHVGRLPAHWHFLGYSSSTGGRGRSSAAFSAFNKDIDALPGEGDILRDGEPDTGGLPYGNGRLGKAIPLETALFYAGSSSSNYPYNDLGFDLPGDFGQNAPQSYRGLQGSGDREADSEDTGDSAFFAPGQMAGGERQVLRSRFRSANPDAAGIDSYQQYLKLLQDGLGSQGNPLTLLHLLPALFDFMEEVQENADQGKNLSMLENYDLRKDVVDRIYTTRSFSPEEISLFIDIQNSIDDGPVASKDHLQTGARESSGIVGTALSIAVNQRVDSAVLLHDSHQADMEELTGEVDVSGQFSLYPEIYKGLNFPLRENMFILMSLRQPQPESLRWRVVTLISPELDDFVTAFVYAKLEQGRLVIASDENGLSVSSLPIVDQFPKLPLQQEKWQILFYSLLAGLVLITVVAHYRKTP